MHEGEEMEVNVCQIKWEMSFDNELKKNNQEDKMYNIYKKELKEK